MSDVKVIRPRVELQTAKLIFPFHIFAAAVLRLQLQTLRHISLEQVHLTENWQLSPAFGTPPDRELTALPSF